MFPSVSWIAMTFVSDRSVQSSGPVPPIFCESAWASSLRLDRYSGELRVFLLFLRQGFFVREFASLRLGT